MRYLIIKLIEFYQTFLSFDNGLLKFFAPGGACRYSLSCSEFTKQAVLKYGVISGLVLGSKRILSCNSFNRSVV